MPSTAAPLVVAGAVVVLVGCRGAATVAALERGPYFLLCVVLQALRRRRRRKAVRSVWRWTLGLAAESSSSMPWEARFQEAALQDETEQ